MRKYIYPQDLTARATMWLWQLNDLAAIGALCLAGVFCAAQLGFFTQRGRVFFHTA